jgi:8-oxo-dGTP pyrophosphatase MutT (NUDIX family)
MKRWLLALWRWMPFWMQRVASFFVRPRYAVSVGAVVLNEQGRLLLCHHTYRGGFPWGLPGGDVQPGEEPDEAVRRELWEETGLRAGRVELLFIENNREYRQISLTYLCQEVSGTFLPNEEVSRIQYFDPQVLPPLLPFQQVTIERALRRLGL